MSRRFLFALLLCLCYGAPRARPLDSRCLIPGVNPGVAEAVESTNAYKLSNKALSFSFRRDNSVRDLQLKNKITGETLAIDQPFELVLSDGTHLNASNMGLADRNLIDAPMIHRINPTQGSAQLAGRQAGYSISARFMNVHRDDVDVQWKATLLDGSNYLRQEVTVTADRGDISITRVILAQTQIDHAIVRGTVPGSPIASETFFVGFAHPMSHSQVQGGHTSAWLDRRLPLKKGQSVTYSWVVGVSPKGQLRRAFLNYIERERAHPYRPFLHYNSWYDIGYFGQYNEADCLASINAFGQELVQKRKVKMDSFLFDDGWDDYSTVWNFHKGFPNGFTPLKEAAAKYGAAAGVWLSPWGGYGDPRKKRLATGKSQGYEIDTEGYALSGPKYYDRFRQVCLEFLDKYGINQFKFDGTGSPDKQYPGSAFGSDFEAAIQLIDDLRRDKSGLFINLTTGTWPSPFWLRYADSTWRGGDDHSFAGVGTKRQQWITYRDGDTYHGVVEKGQLYPLTSLMLHGLIYAKYADNLKTDPGNDFRDEIHDYFGNGTQLQEMYITHSLLSKQNWDDLAEAANWSRANADVLVDTHWIGGDPLKLEVYGWASWSPRKGILVLRNPSDQVATFYLNMAKILELPPSKGGVYFEARCPWKADTRTREMPYSVRDGDDIVLKPFEVLVLDLTQKSDT